MYFICLAHALQCYSNANAAEDPVPTDCKDDPFCAYIEKTEESGKIAITQGCIHTIAIGDEILEAGKCWKLGSSTVCKCDTDNCNYECSAVNCPEGMRECDANCKASGEGPEKNVTKQTDTTTANETKPNPTDDSAGATSEDGPQPTDDSAIATDEDGPQPTNDITGFTGEEGPQQTGDGAGATAEDAEERQKTTGKAGTNSVNVRVVESDQYVFAVWILVTLVVRSVY